ncbi:MAG: lipopolysaccharide export system permease protein [Pseudomonadota bacterium]|jgi:lipopolysaccharide export system permease protein|nr:lipopolysaccharide export system permease protein [Pseudomonadota bacterium]MDQ5902724.1 lipopolysaccharide export system permease protein [Pseudomonadota bacterium]MDQ5905778.1 lipopolysaccharide export system permease protein [Pseudomonadota bacterium]MDQ5915144.1 lipopolysaccharide export system permease protein [Pseudomonadota bacterium]MDQ5959691.1 lipopolysaccharide export system permease protein [Pseudomonadota bacterium]
MILYKRYLVKEISGAVLLVLVAFLALFSFFDLIAELRDVGKGGYQLQHALGFIVLKLPGRIYELMPIAVLIGALYAISTLARHSEITVLRASGLSTGRLLLTLLQIAAVFGLITLATGELLVPPVERMAKQFRLSSIGKLMAQEFRTGLWVKDDMTFVNVRSVTPDGQLRSIRIYEFNKQAQLASVSEAEEGVFLPPASWTLKKVVRTSLDGNRGSVSTQPEVVWDSALNPDILAVLLVRPETMSIMHLVSYTKHLRDNKQKTQRYEIALWKKAIYPIAVLVMIALALPFGYTHNRVAGVSLKIFAGVMIGVLFHMLNGLFSNLGAINSWPPFTSAAMPSLLFAAAAAAMLWWVERR